MRFQLTEPNNDLTLAFPFDLNLSHPMPFQLRPKRRRRFPPNPQGRSPLFATLPSEIRLQIFSLALQCSPIPLAAEGPRDHLVLTLQTPGIGGPQVAAVRAARLLSLLLTCSIIHAEALPLLYGINTVSTGDPVVIRLLAAGVGAPFLKRLDFSWTLAKPPIPVQHPKGLMGWLKSSGREDRKWVDLWEAMKRFHHLRWLCVELNVLHGWTEGWQEREAEILMPLQDLLNEEGAHGELVLTWVRDLGQGNSAEEILKQWEVLRRVPGSLPGGTASS